MNNRLFNEIKHRFEQNDLIGAEILCLKVYEQDKKNIHAVKNLALAYLLQKKFHPALIMYQEAFKLNNQDSDVSSNLAYLYKEAEDFKLAIEYCDLSINSNPNNALPYKLLGEIYLKLRKFGQSKKFLEEALDKSLGQRHLIPFIQELNYRYIEVLGALNDKDNSIKMINKSLKNSKFIDPDILAHQVRSYPEETNHDYIDEATKLHENFIKSNDKNILRLAAGYASALAHHYQNKNDLTKSENYFISMNKIIDKLRDYRPLEIQKTIKNIIKSYNNLPIPKLESNFGAEMIFIVGMPRSGTTLLESIVADPDYIQTGGELGSFKNLIQFEITTFSKGNVEKIQAYLNHYINKMRFILGDKKFLVDKLPFNIFLIGFIRKYLPAAKILIINRDPWDNAKSIYKELYIDSHFYSSKFFNIAMQLSNFTFAKNYWQNVLKKDENNIFELDYQSLVKNPLDNSKNIYEFLKIDHELDLENRKRFYSNTSSFSQVKRDINLTSGKYEIFSNFKDQFLIDLKDQSKYWENTKI